MCATKNQTGRYRLTGFRFHVFVICSHFYHATFKSKNTVIIVAAEIFNGCTFLGYLSWENYLVIFKVSVIRKESKNFFCIFRVESENFENFFYIFSLKISHH